MLERTVRHRIDILGSQLLAFWIGDAVIHSHDLATAIGVDPELDEFVEFVYGFYVQIARCAGALYTTGWFGANETTARRCESTGAAHPPRRSLISYRGQEPSSSGRGTTGMRKAALKRADEDFLRKLRPS